MTNQNKITLFIAVVLIVLAIVWLDGKKIHPITSGAPTVSLAATSTGALASSSPAETPEQVATARAQKAAQYPPAVEIVNPTGFVNTGNATPTGTPITLSQYVGKDVILIDFMTYSCINCQRTFPYLEAWYQKYKDQGLVVIGIHTPEFQFEKDYANVAAAMQRFGITFPVVLDSNYGTWNAYQNEYWPHEFLIDIDGYIREDHVGEGGYDETEKNIQKLLDERDQRLGIAPTFDTALVNPAGAITSIQAESPETYFGSNRNEYLGNGTKGKSGVQNFTVPATLADNTFYFGGSWNVDPEFAESQASGASIAYAFNAMRVYFVAGAKSGTVEAEVTLDGMPVPANLRGKDIIEQNGKTYVNISADRLYDLIDGTTLMHHTLEITAKGAGLDAYTFTFG